MSELRGEPLPYLAGYPAATLDRARELLAQRRVAPLLRQRYPEENGVRTDAALYDFAVALKGRFMRNAEPLSKVVFDHRLHVIHNALGTHTTVARVQGSRLKAKREIRVAGLFRDAPAAFLRMIVVHELAHLKERAHGRAFYALCEHMEPEYHRLEFDLRLYLTDQALTAAR